MRRNPRGHCWPQRSGTLNSLEEIGKTQIDRSFVLVHANSIHVPLPLIGIGFVPFPGRWRLVFLHTTGEINRITALQAHFLGKATMFGSKQQALKQNSTGSIILSTADDRVFAWPESATIISALSW